MAGRQAQRKAWNEAMKSAAGASALPKELQARHTSRRSDRRKQARREKARKVTVLDDEEYRAALWLDALEEVDPSGPADAEEEAFDELEEMENKRKRRKTPAKTKAGVLPKRFKSRSFASILLEEAGRADGIPKEIIDAETRLLEADQLHPRRFCPVTGQLSKYKDPKSGIGYANQKALDQIRERAPPWMTLSGTAAYHEAVKSLIENDIQERRQDKPQNADNS